MRGNFFPGVFLLVLLSAVSVWPNDGDKDHGRVVQCPDPCPAVAPCVAPAPVAPPIYRLCRERKDGSIRCHSRQRLVPVR